MNKLFILPVIVTFLNILYDRFIHKASRSNFYYVIFFLFLFLCCYFYPAQSEEISEDEIDVFIESLMPKAGLTQEKRNLYFRACNQFALEGLIHLGKADDIILLHPRSTKREQAHRAIEGAVASIVAADVKAKVVTVLLVFLAGYLQDVYDNWSDIKYHLSEGERMLEIHDYYQDKLFRNAE